MLDFYEYVKQKKQKDLQKKWEIIEEDEPKSDEEKLFQDYKNDKEGLVTLDNVINELNLNKE